MLLHNVLKNFKLSGGLQSQAQHFLTKNQNIQSCSFSSTLPPVDHHDYLEVFTSDSNDIFFNLSIEQMLFEKDLKVPRLMLWKNSDSVVVGKYQNQWQECNMFNLEEDGVPVIRRKTGGGTVYHDLGNICFSFITPIYNKDIFPLDPRQYNVQILQNAMNSLGIATGLTARKDLTIQSHKISGSAYQANMGNKSGEGKKCLHHGTLLLSANKERLWRYLKPKEKKITSKAQESVVSKVANIADFNPEITEQQIFNSFTESFMNFFKVKREYTKFIHFQEGSLSNNEYITNQIAEFKSWEWIYGQTPSFTNQISIDIKAVASTLTISIRQEKGLSNLGFVEEMNFTFSDPFFYYSEIALNDAFSNSDQKVRYGIYPVSQIIQQTLSQSHSISQMEKDIITNEVISTLSHLL